jgi:hypothetical protein
VLLFDLPCGLREAHASNPGHFLENDVVLLWKMIAVYGVPIVGQLIQSVGQLPQMLLINHRYVRGERYRK